MFFYKKSLSVLSFSAVFLSPLILSILLVDQGRFRKFHPLTSIPHLTLFFPAADGAAAAAAIPAAA
jgi:hypothetical protein